MVDLSLRWSFCWKLTGWRVRLFWFCFLGRFVGLIILQFEFCWFNKHLLSTYIYETQGGVFQTHETDGSMMQHLMEPGSRWSLIVQVSFALIGCMRWCGEYSPKTFTSAYVGDCVCFVSHKYHNVTPVTAGSRRSFVIEMWQGSNTEDPGIFRISWHLGNMRLQQPLQSAANDRMSCVCVCVCQLQCRAVQDYRNATHPIETLDLAEHRI